VVNTTRYSPLTTCHSPNPLTFAIPKYYQGLITKKLITEKENAVLVGLVQKPQDERQVNEYLDELSFLALTAGAKTKKRFIQKLYSKITTSR